MRNGFLGAIIVLMAGAGLATAQIGPGPIGMPGDMPAGPGGPEGVIGYPPPSNPQGLATNDVGTPFFWLGVDYLGWWAKSSHIRYALVTTSTDAQNGVFGANTTSTLYTGPTGNDFLSGGRVTTGMFFASDNRFGVEGSFFLLGKGDSNFNIESQGSGAPLIARTYIDAGTGQAASAVISSVNIGPGRLTANTTSQNWGADAHWLLNLYRSSPQSPWGFNLNLFAGMSFFSLRESFNISSSTDYFNGVSVPFNGANFTSGESQTVTTRTLFGTGRNAQFLQTTTDSTSNLSTGIVDRFRTSNQFYGAELGFSDQLRFGRWSLGFTGKLGLGAMHTSVNIEGYSTLFQVANQNVITQRLDAQGNVQSAGNVFTQNSTTETVNGGLYAVNGRTGSFSHTRFAYVPEGILTLSYQFTPTVTGTLGCDVLWVSKVVRVNDTINQTVDPALIPTNSLYGTGNRGAPQVDPFQYSHYWLMGFNAGLSIQF